MTKPIILSVDDDPEVLAAVERDLREHYRGEYRVLKARSGEEALEAAREPASADARGAVPRRSADAGNHRHRFPREARKLFPTAEVLLTAYADTEAAIASINEIGLDHYLLKPWHPPELRLYPVLDDLLATWRAECGRRSKASGSPGRRGRRRAMKPRSFWPETTCPISGSTSNATPRRASWCSSSPAASPGCRSCSSPTAAPGRAHRAELAGRVGLATRADRKFYDLVIVGGGPAGLANAVYGASEGPDHAPGRAERPRRAGGHELADRELPGVSRRRFGGRPGAARHGAGAPVRRRAAHRAAGGVRPARGSLSRRAAVDGSEISSYAVCWSQGMAVRRLEVPGIEKLIGRGRLLRCGDDRDRDLSRSGGRGRRRREFGRAGGAVLLALREPGDDAGPRPAHQPRACPSTSIDRIAATPNIEVMTGAETAGLSGTDHLEQLDRDELSTRREATPRRRRRCSSSSAAHRTPSMVAALVELDEKGYILTGADLPRTDTGGPKAGRWTGTRSRWRPTCRASSPLATYGLVRVSGSPPQWARGQAVSA